MNNRIIQNRIYGVWENCLNVTSSDYLTFLETLPAGCYVKSYEWSQSNPLPSVNIGNNKIVFAASGLVWNISIYDSGNNPLYFLYCCEGSGSDGLNLTVHNGYANNSTTHFLVSSSGKWSKVYRDNIYKYGYSTKTGLSLLTEKITNGTFTSNVTGWSNCTNGAIARDTTYFSNGGAKVTRSGTGANTTGAYQAMTGILKLYRYEMKSDTYIYNIGTNFNPMVVFGYNSWAYWGSSWVNFVTGISSSVNTVGLHSCSGKQYFSQSTVYVTLYYPFSYTGESFNYDNISVKIFEDAIKIPTLMTDRTKDCLGNTKTN